MSGRRRPPAAVQLQLSAATMSIGTRSPKIWSGTATTATTPSRAKRVRLCCAISNGVSGVDTSTGGPDRRLIYAAIINCLANGPFPPGSNATNVPVAGFGQFFVTQPVRPSGNTLYSELIGLANPQMVSVQLYR